MVCKNCQGRGEEKPIFEVMQVGDKLMDSPGSRSSTREVTRSLKQTASTGG